MAKEKDSPPMRAVTFRMLAEAHEELSQLADDKGIDLTSLLNQIISDARPVIRAGLDAAKRREAAMRLRVKPEHLEFVLAARDAGRGEEESRPDDNLFLKRANAIQRALKLLGKLDPEAEQEITLAAIRLLREEDEGRRQKRGMTIADAEDEATRESAEETF